jgi:diguanylate cyclase (GGDEF)-like protein
LFTVKHPLRLTSTGLVIIPIIVASVMTGVLAVAIAWSGRWELTSKAALLISAILIYAATLFFLGRSGIATIRGLEQRANVDPLTGLPNRHALHEDILRVSRGNEEVALAMIDLDSFKQVNDHYGHAVGDQLIEQCAGLLREICGTEARAYRLGGDEFAAVMSGKVAGTILEGLCRTLLEKLGTPLTLDHFHIAVGASIGLARSTADQRVPSSEMLRRADVAMDMSKRGGKMRCTWFNESFDRRRERVREIEDEIRTGIAAGEFHLAYQPLVNAGDKRIVAVEALLRWNRGGRDPLTPNIFIPVAEDSGLINPLGVWVLRQAVCDALRWGDITLSVNISAAQLRNAEFPIKLGEVLEETGFPPHRLELEVTETCLVLDPVVAERTLDVIRSFGVHIVLDDFGTGYASIGFLRRFRFEKLKLDRSLVELAGVDDGSRAMMLSSIALARALDMGVTAEGVETEEQAELVRLAGCDQIQGWLYHRAVPAPEIDRLIAEQNAAGALPLQRDGKAA